jgi:hypothetical protein
MLYLLPLDRLGRSEKGKQKGSCFTFYLSGYWEERKDGHAWG